MTWRHSGCRAVQTKMLPMALSEIPATPRSLNPRHLYGRQPSGAGRAQARQVALPRSILVEVESDSPRRSNAHSREVVDLQRSRVAFEDSHGHDPARKVGEIVNLVEFRVARVRVTNPSARQAATVQVTAIPVTQFVGTSQQTTQTMTVPPLDVSELKVGGDGVRSFQLVSDVDIIPGGEVVILSTFSERAVNEEAMSDSQPLEWFVATGGVLRPGEDVTGEPGTVAARP